LALALKTATLAAFLVGVWAFRVIEPSEFATLRAMVRQRIRPLEG
jgi:hypothetical protein